MVIVFFEWSNDSVVFYSLRVAWAVSSRSSCGPVEQDVHASVNANVKAIAG